jgi:hypothetical protein
MSGQDEHQRLDGELLSRRLVPSRRFQDGLRRHLLELQAEDRRPAHLLMLVMVYAAAGILLIIIGAGGVGA